MTSAARGQLLRVVFVLVLSLLVWMWLEYRTSISQEPQLSDEQRLTYQKIRHEGALPRISPAIVPPAQRTAGLGSPPSKAVEITVRVMSDRRTPIEGALVYIAPEDSKGVLVGPFNDGQEGITGGDGLATVSLDPKDLKESEVIATRHGFRPARVACRDMSTGPGAVSNDLLLMEGLSISGQALDESGNPVQGLEIQAYGPHSGGTWGTNKENRFAFEDLPDIETTLTDAGGSFRLTGLKNARYVLSAGGRGYLVAHDSTRGVVPVRAGTTGVVVEVRRTMVARLQLANAVSGRAVSLADVILDIDSSEGIVGWSPASIGEQVGGLGLKSPELGEWVFPIHIGPDSLAEAGLFVTIRGIGLSATRVRAQLHPMALGTMPPIQKVFLEPESGPRGTLRVSLRSDVSAPMPYCLVIRRVGDADRRWHRMTVQFDVERKDWSETLPIGQYELTGQGLVGFSRTEPWTIVTIEEARTVEATVSIPPGQWGSTKWRVMSNRGVRLSDYYYRLVSKAAFLRGDDSSLYQGFVSRGADDSSDTDGRLGVLCGDYVLVVVKYGFGRQDIEMKVMEASTAVTEVVLQEE